MGLTIEEARGLIETLEMGGCRTPEAVKAAPRKAAALWAAMLCDLTPEQAARGAAAYLRSGGAGFWPTPGQIAALGRAEETPESLADRAWQLLFERVRTCPDVPFEEGPGELDRAAQAGIRELGGWQHIIQTLPASPHHEARIFRAAFVHALKRERGERERAALDHIVGRVVAIAGSGPGPRRLTGGEA